MREIVTFQNSRKLNLVGDWYSANTKKCIIICHGFTGDRHEWGRFDKIAESFNKDNFNVLSFDFSGSGESDDDTVTVEKEVDDLKSAIDFVGNKDITDIFLFGHSLGGLVSLISYNEKIRTMVLTAPVTDKKDFYIEEKYGQEKVKEMEEKGNITLEFKKGPRKKFVIDKKYITERQLLDQDELLKPIKVPILIIHGGKDEDVPLQWSKTAIKKLPVGSKLEVLDDADHGFYEHINKIIILSLQWFKKYSNC